MLEVAEEEHPISDQWSRLREIRDSKMSRTHILARQSKACAYEIASWSRFFCPSIPPSLYGPVILSDRGPKDEDGDNTQQGEERLEKSPIYLSTGSVAYMR